MFSLSVYIHIPFCIHRCGYCDFNTYAGLDDLIPEYVNAVCKEIELLSPGIKNRAMIATIYFGGGTPSILPAYQIENILSAIYKRFTIKQSVEISLEANPGTVSKQYLQELKKLGVNRISFGMQSANQAELTLLGRQHNFMDVTNAVEWSRAAGIKNLNLDLIFGVPKQNLKPWIKNLEAALTLQPEHLSLYALSIEEGTPLAHGIHAGLLPEPDQDLMADMYEAASNKLEIEGFSQYEISNWAKMDKSGNIQECEHNLQYWRTLPYLGIGAGAHGFIDHQRTVNYSNPARYIRSLLDENHSKISADALPRTPATQEINSIDTDTEIGETMMMGLRLVAEGVSNLDFYKRFGISLHQSFQTQIERLIALGLLEWAGSDDEILRLTKKGRLLGNQVFMEFI